MWEWNTNCPLIMQRRLSKGYYDSFATTSAELLWNAGFLPLYKNYFRLHFEERSEWKLLPENSLLAFQAIHNITWDVSYYGHIY